MKAKNLFLSAVLLLAGVGMVADLSPRFQASFQQDVLRAAGWSDFQEGDPSFGTSYQVPKMSYELNGVSYPASVIVTFPDGTQSADSTLFLDQAGVHTFEYSVRVNGEIHNITKQIKVGFPQMRVGNREKSSIEYITAEQSKELGAAGTAGMYVKLGMGDTLNFTKPIYLDEMNDTTALVKGYIAPLSKGSVDFNQLFIKLTDADDPNKFVILCYYSHVETGGDGRTTHSSSAMARSDAQPYFAGIHQSQGLHTNDKYGLWSGVVFDGYMKDKNGYKDTIDEAQFVFGFNYANKVVYGTGFGKGQTLDTVLDLDEVPTQVETAWTGFTSNRAFLSIYAESYSGSTANFVISEVAGVSAKQMADNSFTDSEEPEISIDTDFDSLPNGAVGYYYPVPTAKAYDQVSLDCPVKTEVFYNYFSSDRTSVKIKDGKFYMDKEGTYTICYTSFDKAGNKAESLRTISVFKNMDKPDFDMPAHEDHIAVGDFFTVNKKIATRGGVGEKTVEAYYEVDGKRFPIEGNGFRITELKTYKVMYRVTDMIGQVSEKGFDIRVVDSKKPILEKKIHYPKYLVSGGYYEFPTEKVFYYENGALVEKQLTLEVTDSNGTKTYANEDFCPVIIHNKDKVTIKAKCGDEVLQSDEIVVMKNMGTESSARSINLTNYLMSDGIKKELTPDDGMLLTTTKEEAKFDFVTPFYLDSFSLDIKALLGFANHSGIVVRITDFANDENQIEARIALNNDVTTFEVNGTKSVLVNNDINVGNNNYVLGYKNGSFTCGDTALPVKTFANGDAFQGFESLKGYMSLEFENCPVGANLHFVNFCQCGFSSRTARDRVSPVVQMDDNYGGTRNIHTTYHIDPAYSFDVLSPNTVFTLDVLSPSGQPVKALDGTLLQKADPTKGYDISLEEYGQYYFTLTTIEDSRFLSNGSELTISYYVSVYDDVAPVVEFSTGMKKEAKVGETVLLPEFTASDNITKTENLIIQRVMLTPRGDYRYLDESYTAYTFQEEGTYRFMIRVMDEAGNIVSKTFETVVTKA